MLLWQPLLLFRDISWIFYTQRWQADIGHATYPPTDGSTSTDSGLCLMERDSCSFDDFSGLFFFCLFSCSLLVICIVNYYFDMCTNRCALLNFLTFPHLYWNIHAANRIFFGYDGCLHKLFIMNEIIFLLKQEVHIFGQFYCHNQEKYLLSLCFSFKIILLKNEERKRPHVVLMTLPEQPKWPNSSSLVSRCCLTWFLARYDTHVVTPAPSVCRMREDLITWGAEETGPHGLGGRSNLETDSSN